MLARGDFIDTDDLNLSTVATAGESNEVASPKTTFEPLSLDEAFLKGDVDEATRLHHALMPVFVGIFRTQGAILTKAALDLLGLPGGPLRLPLVGATEAERGQLLADLRAGGVEGLPA